MNSPTEVTNATPVPDERIVIAHGDYGVITIKYVGADPETRYLPRDESRWSHFREVVRQIFRDPPDGPAD